MTRSRSFISQEPSTKILTKSPPSITVGLRPQLEVFESSNPLEFKVIYLGEPMPNVTWKKNDVPITEGTSEKIKHKNNCSTLVLDQVMAEDSGQYSCSVENVQGKVETFCKLTVLPKSMNLPLMNDMNGQDNEQPMTIQATPSKKPSFKPCPPAIIDHLKSVQAEDGTEIELSCKIVCPSGNFDVVWIHNGKEIRPSPDFQYHHSENSHLFSLKIPELFPEDSGIFTCEAFNDYGETFTSCSLFVTCPGVRLINDVFKTFPKSVSVARGAPIVVFAELTPGCDRQVSWIKDQTLVDQTNANNIEQGRVQFSIVEAGPRDSGLYELLTVYNGEEHRAAFAINVL